MELLLLVVILLVTKLTTTCNTSLANQDIPCTDPGNYYTFEECDWNVQGWTYEQGVTGGFYFNFTAHYGVLKSNLFCPSREETYCLQFRFMMGTTTNLSVQILHDNGINQTLWNVINEKSNLWMNAQIPIQTKESFRIVIQSWKDTEKETDLIGIDSIVYIKSSCAPLPEYAFVTTTPLTTATTNLASFTPSASFTPTTLSSPESSCSDQQNRPNYNAESEGEEATPLPAIIGSIVGVLVMVIALVVLILLLMKRRESKHKNNTSTDKEKATSCVAMSHISDGLSADDYPGIRLPKLNNEKPQKNNYPRTISSDDYINTNLITKHTERPATTTGANFPLKFLNTAIASKSSFEAEGDYTAVDTGDNPVAKDISMASSRTETEPDEDCVRINKPDLRFAYSQVLTKGDNSKTMDSKARDETLAGDTNARSPQVSDTYSQVQKKFISMDIGSRTDDVMHAGDVSDTYSLVRRNANSVTIANSAVEYNRIDFSNPKPSNKLDTYNTVDLPPTSAKSEGVEKNEKACEPTHVNSSEDVYNTLDVEGDRSNSGRAYINDQKTGEVTQHTYAHMGQNLTTGNDTYAKVQNNKTERVFSSDYDHVN